MGSELLSTNNFPDPVPPVWPLVDAPPCDLNQLYNPAAVDVCIATYGWASPPGVDEALRAAKAAFSDWSVASVATRISALNEWLDRIEANSGSVAQAITREQGKPIAEAHGEIGKSLREARQMLGFAQQSLGYGMPGRTPGFQNLVIRRSRGIALAITPWNFPALTPMRKLVPALATGNVAVLKPSEFTPATALILTALSDGILPPGVLSFVNGGAEVAASLVADSRIDAVSFTGSVATGRKIAAVAGGRLCPVSLELGGKNAVILDDVAELDAALDAIAAAAFQCSGQRCTSISRVILHRDIWDKGISGLKARLGDLVAGPGLSPEVTLGPITTDQQFASIQDIIARALAAGAELILGGEPTHIKSAPNGRFFAPTLVATGDPTNPAMVEEIFGPVLTLIPFDSPDQAIALLNASDYGLTSAIFTDDLRFSREYLQKAHTGMLHVNHGTMPDDNMPFVGVKNSGLGIGSVGKSTLEFFTTEHATYVAG